MSVESPKIDEKTLPMGFRPVYNTYVDVVIEHLGGKSFRGIAEDELIRRFLQTVRPSYWSKVKPELKKDKIIIIESSGGRRIEIKGLSKREAREIYAILF